MSTSHLRVAARLRCVMLIEMRRLDQSVEVVMRLEFGVPSQPNDQVIRGSSNQFVNKETVFLTPFLVVQGSLFFWRCNLSQLTS